MKKFRSYKLNQPDFDRYFKWPFLISLVVFLAICVFRTPRYDLDFKVFYRSAALALNGSADLYNLLRDGAWAYRYGPSFAILLSPLALFSLTTAQVIWGVINSLGFALAWFFTEGVLRNQFPNLQISNRARLLTLIMVFNMVLRNAIQGNVNVLMYLTAIGGLYFHLRHRSVLAGLVIALGTATKIFPGAVLLYLIATRGFASIISFLGFMIVLLVILPASICL